tara:strand:+ start:10535 stop:10657 length:123 start_codon:yes stop_codon:yes gene_type:complete
MVLVLIVLMLLLVLLLMGVRLAYGCGKILLGRNLLRRSHE